MAPSTRKRGQAFSQNAPYSPPLTRSKKKKLKFSSLDLSQLPSTSNEYAMLNPNENISDCDSMISFESSPTRKPNGTVKAAKVQKSLHKPPPLNIVGVEYAYVNDLLKVHKQNADDYSLSLAPFGIRVFSANIDKYRLLKCELEKNNCKFFTYQLREEQTTKIVLHGLFDMPIDDLQKCLEEVGVKPLKIKKMNIHQKKYSDHCLYLLYFLKSDQVKISRLREIPAICSVKVRWQYYSNKREGPIQCSNCMSLGHGGANCFLNPVCIRCAKDHKSVDCPLLNDPITGAPRPRIPDDQVKCGLCGQNHPANYRQCVKRLEFVQRQTRYRAHTQRQQPQTRAFVNAPQLAAFNFPALNPRARAERFEQANQPQNSNQWTRHENELFSPTQLMSIFKELMAAISQARTKMEQISALGEIAIKYCNR
jgi:hypothetical protein